MNMTKEYRAELRRLKRERRLLLGDHNRTIVSHQKQIKECQRQIARLAAGRDNACIKIDRRIAILEGRLA